jgi:hypothetical protein
MPFDYNAPAELFLAKRTKNARTTGGSQRRLRPSVTPSRTYGHPKPPARGLMLGMSASTVTKFNDCTKPVTIRCPSLSDRPPRARVRNETGGPLRLQISGRRPPSPSFKYSEQAPGLGPHPSSLIRSLMWDHALADAARAPRPTTAPATAAATTPSTSDAASKASAASASAASASASPAAAAPASPAAPATSASDQLDAGRGQCGVFLVEDIERRQADIGDFFFTERDFVTGVGTPRRHIDCGANRLRRCAAR